METTDIKELLRAKKLPKWMTSHQSFKALTKINKVFPSIGLINCSEPCDFHGNFAYESAKTLLNSVKRELNNLFDICETQQYYDLCSIIEQFDTLVVDRIEDFIRFTKGKISIKLPEVITVQDVVKYAKNIDLDALYILLNAEFSNRGFILAKISSLIGHKEFHANNQSVDKASIAFSSSGIQGLWDIATMSMRGIRSCIRWEGQHKLTLIGSIADPFTGVIYLATNKKEKLGSQMVKRCVVRFVIDGRTNTPYLLIDRMYPSLDERVLRAFTDFIVRKTSDRLPIHYGPTIKADLLEHSYIPKAPAIANLAENILPYRDTKIPIGRKPSRISDRKQANIRIKQHNFATGINKAINHLNCVNAITDDQIKLVLNDATIQFLVPEYGRSIAEYLYDTCENDSQFQSSDEYLKRLCYAFFADKRNIAKSVNAKFTRTLNNYYKVKLGPNKIKQSQLKPMFDYMISEISKSIKQQALTLVSKKATK